MTLMVTVSASQRALWLQTSSVKSRVVGPAGAVNVALAVPAPASTTFGPPLWIQV